MTVSIDLDVVKTTDFGEQVIFFKGVLNPKTVLELAETVGQPSD